VAVHQAVGGEDVHDALAVHRLKQVLDVQHRLTEELQRALLLELKQPALNGADARRGDVAVLRAELRGIVAEELEYGAQVGKVEEQEAVVISDAKRHREHAFLGLVEVEQSREEQRTHVGDRRPHGMALFAVDIPHRRRTAAPGGFG
jgi:hypothetical protein